MKLLGVAIGLQITLFVLFMVGLFSQWTIVMFAAFCLWTPTAWAVGYHVHRSGWQPLTFRPETKPQPAPVSHNPAPTITRRQSRVMDQWGKS